jgi:ATP-dependent Clp protease ATP-binding subunit ClpA
VATMVERLDPTRRSAEAAEFALALRQSIVGQEEGVQAVVDLYQVFRAGMNVPGRPLGNLLFLYRFGQDAHRRGHR